MTDELTACREALAEARRELAAAWASARAHEQLCSEQYDRAEKAEALLVAERERADLNFSACKDLESRLVTLDIERSHQRERRDAQRARAEKAEATVAEQETVIAQVWDALFDLSSRTRPQWRTPDLWLLVSELQAILVAARKMKG